MGTHPGWPTPVADGGTLAELVAADPERHLGREALVRFGPQVPFLLKVLAAGRPLSVQVHPTPEQARAGFLAENLGGIALDDPARNYVDDRAKPEMMLAVEPMRALCGFRPIAEVRADLRTLLGTPEGVHATLDRLLAGASEQNALRGAVELLLGGAQEVDAFRERIVAAAAGVVGDTADVIQLLAATHPGDPGTAVAVLLNHVRLAPGEAVFLDAGTMHAYLSGLGVEVMSTSDNVLRGGLTSKHVDVAELSRITRFEASRPFRVTAEEDAPGRFRYRPPVAEFQLQRLEVAPGERVAMVEHAPSILLVTSGEVELASGTESVRARRGGSLFIGADEGPVTLLGTDCRAVAYSATLG